MQLQEHDYVSLTYDVAMLLLLVLLIRCVVFAAESSWSVEHIDEGTRLRHEATMCSVRDMLLCTLQLMASYDMISVPYLSW